MSNKINATIVPEQWWNQLEAQWKKAFNEALLQKGPILDMPDEDGLKWILEGPNFRFAGPGAHHPNMSFELTNLSGLSQLTDTELISATNHKIESVKEIASLKKLKHLFLNENLLEDLTGIEGMKDLESLYVNKNKLRSILIVKDLTNLQAFYCNDNPELNSFDGITEKHSNKLKQFVCLPNDAVPQKEIIRVENKIGVRCIRG